MHTGRCMRAATCYVHMCTHEIYRVVERLVTVIKYNTHGILLFTLTTNMDGIIITIYVERRTTIHAEITTAYTEETRTGLGSFGTRTSVQAIRRRKKNNVESIKSYRPTLSSVTYVFEP